MKTPTKSLLAVALCLILHLIVSPVCLAQPILKEGETAYVRVKQYSPQSGEPTVQEASGAAGYTVRQLNTSLAVVATIAKPTGKDPTFAFGESVTLVEKKPGVPPMWIVAKGQSKVSIPAYILTPNKAEIDFLREKDRIPESMSYIYENDGWKVWGMEIGGIGNSFVIDSHGLSLMAFAEGTSPFALKGNAVLFDDSTAKANWKKPAVFDRVKTPFQLSPSHMYYCVSDGDKPAFECVDTTQLTLQKAGEAKTGDIGEMKRLLDQGADVNAPREHGLTALANAAIDGDIKMVEFLLTKNANVNVRDKDGTTPLCFACTKGHVEIVKALLAKGADVKLTGTGNSSPLHLASSVGSLEIVKLLVKNGADVNASRKDGVTPLMHAAQGGHADVLSFLLASGANANAKENSEALSALIIASQAGDTNIVQALLDNKANADVQDDYGWTPLMKSALKGHAGVATLLLNKGAQVNLTAKQGETALYLACQSGNVGILELLLANKATVNTKRNDGVTPLIIAAYKGYTDIVRLLLQNGADTKPSAQNGMTALEAAKNDEIKQLLSKQQ
jgi:ankyrin repeat protein